MIHFNLSLLKTAIKHIFFYGQIKHHEMKVHDWDVVRHKPNLFIIFFFNTGTGVVSAVLSGANDSSVSSQFCVV